MNRLFSLSNLQYLVLHIPGTEKNVFSAALSYFYPQPFFDDVDSLPYFFMIAAGLIALATIPFAAESRLAAPASFADVFGFDLLFDMDGKGSSARLGFISRGRIRIWIVHFLMDKVG